MEVYERIRDIRKNHLHLTQEKFGERLGVSRSVIKNIELNNLAKPEQKEPLIKLICKEFNIDYHWLTTGEGKMFVESDTTYIDLVNKIMASDNIFAKNALKSLTRFNDSEWEKLDKMIDLIIDKK